MIPCFGGKMSPSGTQVKPLGGTGAERIHTGHITKGHELRSLNFLLKAIRSVKVCSTLQKHFSLAFL